MTLEQKKEIQGYIKRCILDIARKGGVTVDEVVLIISEFIPCEYRDLLREKEYYESQEADAFLSTIEAHEQI